MPEDCPLTSPGTAWKASSPRPDAFRVFGASDPRYIETFIYQPSEIGITIGIFDSFPKIGGASGPNLFSQSPLVREEGAWHWTY